MSAGWTEWEDVTERETWVAITPLEEYLFSVQTNIVAFTQGIRLYMRSDESDSAGILVNINIPVNSGEKLNDYISIVSVLLFKNSWDLDSLFVNIVSLDNNSCPLSNCYCMPHVNAAGV